MVSPAPARLAGLEIRDDGPHVRRRRHDLQLEVLDAGPAGARRRGSRRPARRAAPATCRRASRARLGVRAQPAATRGARRPRPRARAVTGAAPGRGRRGVVAEPARRRSRRHRPVARRASASQSGGPARRRWTRSSSASGSLRRRVQRDRVGHGDHSARRPSVRRRAARRRGAARSRRPRPPWRPASAARRRARGRPPGGCSRNASTAACSGRRPTCGGAASRAPISSASPAAARSTSARCVHLGGGHLDRHAAQCGERSGVLAGVVHRPGRRAAATRSGVHSVHRPCPQAVDRAALPTLPGVRGDPADDASAGSTLPFVLVCWTVAALMAFGAIAASDAFLEQQEVQSVCDGAALAAADQADEAVVYAQRRRHRAAAHPRGRAGGGGRPARRRRHAAGRLVGRDRRRRGDGAVHPVRRHRVRLAVPGRRAAGAHGDRSARAPTLLSDGDGPRPGEVGGRRTEAWRVKDSNLRRLSRRIYSPLPLATRATRRAVVPEKTYKNGGRRSRSPGHASAGSEREKPWPTRPSTS